MSKIAIKGSATGTGTFEIAAPSVTTTEVITLPSSTTTLVGTDTVQTLTNKTLTSPTITGTPTVPTAANGTATTQAASTAFVQNMISGYTTISLAGATFPLTLTDTQVCAPVIRFNGVLTENAVVIIPNAQRRLWVATNETTGAFTLTIQGASGVGGVAVAQGKRNLIWSTGSSSYNAFTDFESIVLTGTPTAPTATVGTNNTQIATTAFVLANTPRLTSEQTWSGSQRGTVTIDNDLSFNLYEGNNFACTVSAIGTLTFTNITAGQSGNIYMYNNGNYAISKNSAVKCPASMLAAISTTGYHWLSYFAPNGTTVLVSYAGALA